MTSSVAVDTRPLRERVAGRDWYHTIELEPGLATPGYFDLRAVAQRVLPESLEGARCLDVATFDGFWALEMDKRGASEVVAVDILDARRWDWPVGSDPAAIDAIGSRKGAGEGFEIVMQALGKDIARRDMSVYDLSPETLGRFDFVYVGSLLLHLRDPVRAIERVRSVCDGRALFVDAVDPWLTLLHPRRPLASLDGIGRCWWWKPNVAGLARAIRSGGFELTGRPQRVTMKSAKGFPRVRRSALPSLVRSRALRAELRSALLGDPHAAIMARPVR